MMMSKVVARKDYPEWGILQGQIHYVVKRPFQPVERFLAEPKKSQLVSNVWESKLLKIFERVAEYNSISSYQLESLLEELEDLAQALESQLEFYSSSRTRAVQVAIESWREAILEIEAICDDSPESSYTWIIETFPSIS